ncbi:MAG: AAA family ATPase [Actinomycetota bacterium]|nr:AAA family ATPase [Actinomycetota bacterium]
MRLDRAVAFDGHDGAGKSSTAAYVAEQVGARIVRPFDAALGKHLAWLWQAGRFDETDRLARQSIERLLDCPDERLLFDRHWVTMFTVLPEVFWVDWRPLPPTVVFVADPSDIAKRLAFRGENPGNAAEHRYWVDKYAALSVHAARRLIIDSSKTDPTTARRAALGFVKTVFGLQSGREQSGA